MREKETEDPLYYKYFFFQTCIRTIITVIMFFQWQVQEDKSPDNHQNDDATKNTDGSPTLPAPTQKQYQDLVAEAELLNKEVTAVRRQLWEAQDQLKEKEDKIRTLENHVNELLENREKEIHLMKELREANAELVEQEAKARESLEVMKRVLTRAELKAKEDEETIELLKYDLYRNKTEDDAKRMKRAVEEKERQLDEFFKEADEEVRAWKQKYALANRMVNNLRAQIAAMEDPSGAAKQLEKQRRMIDALEQQIIDLELEELEREDDQRDDDVREFDHEVINRAWLDEDLKESRVREVLQKLDCTK
jgi:chromosome segregation ATPase